MDLIATWDWRAWTLAVLVVGFAGRLLWRWLSALVFRYVLLGGLLRQHGWQAELGDNSGARAAFDQQVRTEHAEKRAHLRQHGLRGLADNARRAKFSPPRSPWRSDVSITGAYRGRTFLASQNRRYEFGSNSGGQGYGTSTRRRALLELYALPASSFDPRFALPRFEARTGLLTGRVRGVPPGLESAVRSRRFRRMRCDGATLFVPLGPRLRRGRLLAGLAHVSAVADRLQERR